MAKILAFPCTTAATVEPPTELITLPDALATAHAALLNLAGIFHQARAEGVSDAAAAYTGLIQTARAGSIFAAACAAAQCIATRDLDRAEAAHV
jgi:hypothetical protein